MYQPILAAFSITTLSLILAVSARPNPVAAPNPNAKLSTRTTSPSCDSPQVIECCDSFANGTGVNCLLSTLNLLDPTCTGGQSLACCDAPQAGLVNIQCVPINVVL